MSESIPPMGTVAFAWESFGLNYTCFRTSRYEAPAHTWSHRHHRTKKRNCCSPVVIALLSAAIASGAITLPYHFLSFGGPAARRGSAVRTQSYTSQAKSIMCCVDFSDRPCPPNFTTVLGVSETALPCPTPSTPYFSIYILLTF